MKRPSVLVLVFFLFTFGIRSQADNDNNDNDNNNNDDDKSNKDNKPEIYSELFVQAEKYIDVSTQVVRQTTRFIVKNQGRTTSTSTFYFALPQVKADRVAIIRASQLIEPDPSEQSQNPDEERPILQRPLPISDPLPQISPNDEPYALWEVNLGQELKPGETITIALSVVLTHVVSPSPKTIKQGDDQQFLYHDSHFIFSPYQIKSQLTRLKLPTAQAKSYTRLEPTTKKGEMLMYGPYEDTQPFSTSPATIHYINNSPFVTITHLQREFEVSHWGNLAVEETYSIVHSGPVLEGPFSRLDYQRTGLSGSVSVLTQRLPEGVDARKGLVYYRDEIGNISTSHLSKFSDGSVKLEILPRFLLVGGWKTNYYMGYNLDLSKYLSRSESDGKFLLNVTFAPQQASLLIDSYTIRVILPEGAYDVQLHTPIPEKSLKNEKHFTYLDTTGRPVLTFTFNNIVAEHSYEYFQVTYSFNQLSMLQEPLLLIFTFFVLFLAAIIFVRIDLSISSN